MPKILFVDKDIREGGHHVVYLRSLLEVWKGEAVLIADNDCSGLFEIRLIIIPYIKGLMSHMEWMKRVIAAAKDESPDIVHFLYGDMLYRYFGIGMWALKCRTIVTFHHMEMVSKKIPSYQWIMRHSDVGVVHTAYLKKCCKDYSIRNIFHVEYPKFIEYDGDSTKEKSRAYFKIGNDKKVLLSLGQPREDKGLDILLEALKKVKKDYVLLVVGTPDTAGFITEDFINKYQICYGIKLIRIARVLSEEEMDMAVEGSDIVVLPYRKRFAGASGPLVEGVWKKKMIIGPNYASIGNIIHSNHLGMTFEVEDSGSLAAVIEDGLETNWEPDDIYLSYRDSLDEAVFQSGYQNIYEMLINIK